MNPLSIIKKFYSSDTKLYQILVNHSRIVSEKSLEIACKLTHLNLNLEFIKNAAMLHDIGIYLTRSESIGCNGNFPYVCHGYLGRELLDEHGLPPEYGLVCERHTGAGITKENIISNKLPLPQRNMVPISIEEKIICVADKYHSKSPKHAGRKITTIQIIEELEKTNKDHAKRFSAWAKGFNL